MVALQVAERNRGNISGFDFLSCCRREECHREDDGRSGTGQRSRGLRDESAECGI